MTDKNKKEKVVLLDAHAIIHRAYHALPNFATSKGEPTGALYGLILMILKIISDLKPDYIIACYDLPKPTYRHEVYEGYKAGRSKTDDELALQLEQSKEVCEAFNIPIYSKEGFEADDMLGTIVEQLKNKKSSIDIIIASGDMDTMQLIDLDFVKVYTLKKGIKDTILYNEENVLKRFGFGPKLLPDFKGLRGDPSDNIIGIKGIGEKTATDLILNFGTIENIYKNLKNNKDKFEKVGIKKRIIELLENGEEEAVFSKMLATIRRDAPIHFVLPKQKWVDCLDINKTNELFKKFEFRSLNEKIKSILEKSSNLSLLPENNSDKKEIEESVLKETALALWVVDSNYTNPDISDILNFSNTDNFEDARKNIFEELKKRGVFNIYNDIEKPLILIINKMQERGILVDKDLFIKINKKYSLELKEIERNIWKEAGVEFNIASPKQLGEILFDKLNITVKNQKKTSTGAKSTKESELLKMKDLHPIINHILEYRELSKILGTYLEPIPKLLDKDNRLHSTFVQTGTTTGRMSSTDPNLQNIPISSEKGRVIRDAFIATPKFSFCAFDYSQIELRIASFLSKDQKMIEIFKSGEDIHTSVASYVFGVQKDDVTKEMRRKAKVINFGILYGMGINALITNLNSDRKTAQEFYNTYFEKFDGLAKYLEDTKKFAEENGFTKTFFGRKRYFDGFKSKIPFIKAMAERMAINAPIQGTQADIIKIAMKKIDKFLIDNKLDEKVFLILQIHDELIYEIEDSLIDFVYPKIIDIMESVLSIKETSGVPIKANFLKGKSWGNLI